jgi:hypothetical protein
MVVRVGEKECRDAEKRVAMLQREPLLRVACHSVTTHAALRFRGAQTAAIHFFGFDHYMGAQCHRCLSFSASSRLSAQLVLVGCTFHMGQQTI